MTIRKHHCAFRFVALPVACRLIARLRDLQTAKGTESEVKVRKKGELLINLVSSM